MTEQFFERLVELEWGELGRRRRRRRRRRSAQAVRGGADQDHAHGAAQVGTPPNGKTLVMLGTNDPNNQKLQKSLK